VNLCTLPKTLDSWTERNPKSDLKASDAFCRTEELTAKVIAAVQSNTRDSPCSYRNVHIACSIRFYGNKISRVVLICWYKKTTALNKGI
jgi:hypothetical protein